MTSFRSKMGGLALASAAAGFLLAVAVIAAWPGLLGLGPAGDREESSPKPAFSVWSDLAAGDRAGFEENLRAFGCPDETIRRIFAEGEDRERVVEAAELAPVVEPAAALPATPAPAPDSEVIVAPEGRVQLPVAFQPFPDEAKMTETQRALLNSIQEDFIAGIGESDQDPASPEYRKRWSEAQRKCDTQFKAAFGTAAFLRQQMAVLHAEQSATPAE